ncbi:MAG: hypothetical protein M3327_01985 [Actinomycetota bacterium]|nr:hypothetical protein [Actinomycetota bacterium]
MPARRTHASRPVVVLSWLVAALAMLACVPAFAWADDGPRTATSVRGEEVELRGDGLYQHDTVFIAEGSRGTDVVTLALGIPFLVVALVLYRRGGPRAELLVIGALTYFFYVYASRALGNAYNGLFPLYIALFSASLFGLVLAVTSLDRDELRGRLAVEQPRRPLAWFLLASAGITSLVWLAPLLSAGARHDAPKYLDAYTTTVTDVIDIGVLVPTLVLAAVLILRREVLGYVLAVALLVLLLFVAATIVAGTVFQLAAHVDFTTGEVVGPIAGFLVLALVAVWLLAGLLRGAGRPGATAPSPG